MGVIIRIGEIGVLKYASFFFRLCYQIIPFTEYGSLNRYQQMAENHREEEQVQLLEETVRQPPGQNLKLG